ncbi:MAG: N(4)-(beta-N-acetylglucosaminyl)-L-asparaginase [Anaerolineae bacterium]
MYLVASPNASVGLQAAMAALREGKPAVDAVETAIRHVEANAEDHSVGYGGYPNLLGEVELDAGLMQGADLTSGSVAALKGYLHPISIARKVMERLPHVLLAGEGAARFAAEMGFAPGNLLTDAARETWAKGLQPELCEAELAAIADRDDLWRWVEIATDPERTHGTTNVIARDAEGHLCVGVSTSGWSWKYPGRVGDSPIPGAGFYADDRYGAAACTGTGEMAIRAATAHSVVMYMKLGLSLSEAGYRAMQDLDELGGRFLAGMNFIAVDAAGNHTAFSSYEDATYLWMDGTMDAPEVLPRVHVPLKQRWEKQRQVDPLRP